MNFPDETINNFFYGNGRGGSANYGLLWFYHFLEPDHEYILHSVYPTITGVGDWAKIRIVLKNYPDDYFNNSSVIVEPAEPNNTNSTDDTNTTVDPNTNNTNGSIVDAAINDGFPDSVAAAGSVLGDTGFPLVLAALACIASILIIKRN